jgi:hypothetical protein
MSERAANGRRSKRGKISRRPCDRVDTGRYEPVTLLRTMHTHHAVRRSVLHSLRDEIGAPKADAASGVVMAPDPVMAVAFVGASYKFAPSAAGLEDVQHISRLASVPYQTGRAA